MHDALWAPTTVGAMRLPHRLATAPMTRDRSTEAGVPTAVNAEYYAQRAGHAMIVTEGTQPSEDGQGYLLTPGIHTPEQADGWARVAEAVHAQGGRIVVQLMHTGRMAHPDNTPHGRQPVAPSAVRPAGQMFTARGMLDMPEPRPLHPDEVIETVDDFRRAARLAVDAGLDGVEIHGANGYLVHQFLSDNANLRTDDYGGDDEGRVRFAVETAAAVAGEIGAGRTGIRLSPNNPLNDIQESRAADLYGLLVARLATLDLAYLHLAHGGPDDTVPWQLREAWPNTLVLNRAGAPLETRVADLEDGLADVVTVGQMALANPDLVDRIKSGSPLNEPDRATFYGGDARGYTDYPTFSGAAHVTGRSTR